MPQPSPEALAFLRTRRSRPAKTLVPPAPDAQTLRGLLEIAARTPDHGKLEPWRFVVLEPAAMQRLASEIPACGARLGEAPERIEKMVNQFTSAPLAVAVIASPKLSDKIPEIEQLLSAGAVCYGLLSAALAAGWGANWLTGWPVHDRAFVERHMGLAPRESVAGIIHIGSESATPPERPRPDLDRIVTWVRT